MKATRIKICGITTPEDALAAAAVGADAIGLNFYPQSPRVISLEQAQRIIAVVPPFLSVVALFVDEPVEPVKRIIQSVDIDLLQFHGSETPQFCSQFDRPWLKALPVKPGVDMHALAQPYEGARAVLLDNWREGVPGGTGERFDWALAPSDWSMSWVLAGGLNPDNVAEAVTTLRPAGVDVSGGVESAPGVKDVEKMAQFVAAVRTADQLNNG